MLKTDGDWSATSTSAALVAGRPETPPRARTLNVAICPSSDRSLLEPLH
jgi:hypothetical protein